MQREPTTRCNVIFLSQKPSIPNLFPVLASNGSVSLSVGVGRVLSRVEREREEEEERDRGARGGESMEAQIGCFISTIDESAQAEPPSLS